MFRKAISKGAFVLLAFCAVGSRALDMLGGHDVATAEEFQESLEDHHRELSEICIDGTTQTYYFEVIIRLVPAANTGVCLLADQVMLGHDINLLLLDYGVGNAGADDEAIFMAGVCVEPHTSVRRHLRWWGGYIWKGGGGCRGCFRDDADSRRLQVGSVTGGGTIADWFSNEYAPWLETTLENAIIQTIAPQYTDCLGSAPEEVDIIINEITLQDLELGCDDGEVIETLQSMSLQDAPLREHDCNLCSSVDFSTYMQNGVEQTAVKGAYVKDEWKEQYGFTVTATGGYSPSFKARIFDTGDSSCVNSANGSLEFGSPNKNCQGGGLGHGDGGEVGESGENCEPVGSKYMICGL